MIRSSEAYKAPTEPVMLARLMPKLSSIVDCGAITSGTAALKAASLQVAVAALKVRRISETEPAMAV